MQLGSHNFDTYARNLRRIMWAEFVDEQMRATRAHQFRASLVESPFTGGTVDLARQFEYIRHRSAGGASE